MLIKPSKPEPTISTFCMSENSFWDGYMFFYEGYKPKKQDLKDNLNVKTTQKARTKGNLND